MVKFTAEKANGRTLVGFGITPENIQALKQGNPIHVHLEELGLPWKGEIVLLYGESEQAIENDLREHGMINKKTQITAGRKAQ